MNIPLSPSSLNHELLSRQTHDALEYVRKEALNIYNRLHSIEEDVLFLEVVKAAYPSLPVLPNLRCGAWYADAREAAVLPYFKSTDGHFSNWSFNLRRPNLHLLSLLAEKEGVIIVDSTRSGKRFPDALSKTIPIWCAVVNRAILARYPELTSDGVSWDINLYTPPASVSKQEHDRIAEKIDTWSQSLAASYYHLPKLPKPLRPFWISPTHSIFPVLPPEFCGVLCVSASKQVEDGIARRAAGYVYVQGSGDDHEQWGQGLTPQLFWSNREMLLQASQSNLSDLISEIVGQSITDVDTTPPTPITKVAGKILICSNVELQNAINLHPGAAFLVLSSSCGSTAMPKDQYLWLHVEEGKKGQKLLVDKVFPKCDTFIKSTLSRGLVICISCPTGKDLSIAVALIALEKYFDAEGSLVKEPGIMSKQSIQTKLQWVISDRPQANPSRSSLQRVNEFLLSKSFAK